MIPVQFGARARPLLAYYDAAHAPRRRAGVLILNPTGWELLRAHRSLRALALRLSTAGFDVLRFDYTGTGDSAGSEEDASLDQWLVDIDDAVEELTGVANVNKVSVIGLRMGARLALEAAHRPNTRYDKIVLWDPAPVSEDILQQQEIGAALSTPQAVVRQMRPSTYSVRARTAVVLSDGEALPVDLANLAIDLAISEPGSVPCWIEDRDFGAGAVPMALIDRVTEWMVRT